jgi:threonyl-tRNA synthetase
MPYAEEVAARLATRRLRVEIDRRREGVSWKIRDAEVQKVPYMLVVGKRERDAGTVSVRRHHGGEAGVEAVEAFADRLALEAAERVIPPVPEPASAT